MSRVLLASPSLLAIAYLAGAIVSFVAEMQGALPLQVVGFLACLAVQFAWTYALYDQFKKDVPRPRWMLDGRTPFFAVLIGSLLLFGVSGTVLAPIVLVTTFAAYLTSIWMAARALVTAEGGEDPHGNRKAMTMGALLYFPLAIWHLSRRVAALIPQPARP
jgi:hypothetical protein